ncbi:MAG: ABC transporter permease, partial [Lentisphaerae bacterium]|nr:ABC transporter permease [Lentisphaerota bacterium]
RIILPLAATVSNLVNFLLSLIVQFILVGVLLAWRGQTMDIHALAIPLLVMGHAIFCLALTVFLSCINVYFRDIQHLVGVGMTAWFFLSPAMYSLALVENIAGPRLMNLYLLNPMAIIITGYRALILKNNVFPWGWPVAGATLFAVVFLICSIALFQKLQRNFSDAF